MARDETIKLSLIDGVTKSLSAIQQGVSGVGASLTKLNQGAELAAKGFGLIGAAVQSIGGAVQSAADLEAALAVIEERTGATAEEMRALDVAMKAALASGLADGQAIISTMTMLAREGLNATQMAQQLGPVLAFAAANATDATAAVASLQDVLGGFNRPAEEIAALADKLTALAKATGTPVDVLQKGLAGVAVQADAAGLSLDNTLLLIAGLSTRAIEGGRASAQLGKAIAELSDPASKAGEALKTVGGNSADLMQSLELLARDSKIAEKVLSELGAKPRAALQALLADGGAALDALREKMSSAGGASQEASDAIGSTLNRAVTQLQNAVTGLRNEFLTPILQPLAEEAAALAEKLNSLADSPQFARLREQFEAFATGAIQAVGRLIENVNFEELTGDIAEFGADTKRVFDDVAYVAGKTADAIRGVSFAIRFLRGDAGLFSESVDSLAQSSERLGDASADAGKTVGALAGNLSKGEQQTRSLAAEALAAVGRLKEFAASMIEAARASVRVSDDIATIFSPSEKAREQLLRLSGGAEQAALGLERLRLARLTSELATLASQGQSSTLTFRALVAEVGKTEQTIATMQAAIDKAAQSQDQLAGSTDAAAGSMRNFAGAARDAGDAAEDVASSNSQVDESYSRIGKQVAAAKIELGDYSDSLIELALAQQSQARSGKEIIQVWAEIKTRFELANQRIKDAIDLIERQNTVLDDETRIRKELERQYGTDSRLLEQLVQLKLKENNERQRAIELSERENEQIERRNAAQAGALNFGSRSADAGTAVGGRGGDASGSGRGDSAPQIVVNVQGAPTDAAGWRDLVSRFIAPELERLQRLSR